MSDLIQRLRFDADCVLNTELGSKGFRGDLVRDFREAADALEAAQHLAHQEVSEVAREKQLIIDMQAPRIAELEGQVHRLDWAHDQCLVFLNVHHWDWESVMKNYPGQ